MTTAAVEGWVGSLDTFAERLAVIRQHMSWNIKEAALACGLPATSWRQWELEGREPRNYIDTVKRISARTRCDYGWLLDGRPSGSPSDPEALPTKREVGSSNLPEGTVTLIPAPRRRLRAVAA